MYIHSAARKAIKSYRPGDIPRGPVSPSFTRDFSVIYITFIERLILGSRIGRVQLDSLEPVTHPVYARRFGEEILSIFITIMSSS